MERFILPKFQQMQIASKSCYEVSIIVMPFVGRNCYFRVSDNSIKSTRIKLNMKIVIKVNYLKDKRDFFFILFEIHITHYRD